MIDSRSIKNYLLYSIGEILLVMIGILLALQVNNWNQNRINSIYESLLVKEINTEWAKNNLPNIDIGIGINTGEAVVGNMGADIRFDYTAIGDTINLAATLSYIT